MDDYLTNEVKIFDPTDKTYFNFTAAGKLHGYAYSLAHIRNWKPTYKFFEGRIYRSNEYFYNKIDVYHEHAR